MSARMVGTDGVIAVGFDGYGAWEVVRMDPIDLLIDYRFVVRSVETGHSFYFVDIAEAAYCLREIVEAAR